jgi:hypothetical protein
MSGPLTRETRKARAPAHGLRLGRPKKLRERALEPLARPVLGE